MIRFGNVTEIRKIEQPLVGRTILSDNPAPIQSKDHWKILEANVLKNLVISPLEEGGVNGDDGLHSFEGKTCSESDGMLLCNSNVIKSIGKSPSKIPPAPFRSAWPP